MDQNTRLAVRNILNTHWLKLPGNAPALNAGFMNVHGLEISGDSVAATGGTGAPKLVTFQNPGEATATFETQIYTPQLLAIITGADLLTSGVFNRRKELKSTGGTLTIPETPVPGSVVVYPATLDAVAGAELVVTVDGSDVTLPESPDDGTKYTVWYATQKTTGVLTIPILSTKTPADFKVWGDCLWKATNGTLYNGVATYYHISPRKELSLSFSNTGDPSSMTITCDVLESDETDDDGNKKFIDLAFEDVA